MKLFQHAITIFQRPTILYYYLRRILRSAWPSTTKVFCCSPSTYLHHLKTFFESYSFRGGIPGIELMFLARIYVHALSGSSVFDVGANVGLFALYLADLFSQCSVFAFEPSGDTSLRLQENLESCNYSQKINHENLAIGLCNNEVLFHSDPRSPATSKIIPTNSNSVQVLAKSSMIESVKGASIDDYCMQACVDSIYFLKVDGEDCEPSVLEGAKRLIEKNLITWIIIEICLNNLESCRSSIECFYERFSSLGLIALRILHNGLLMPLPFYQLREIDLANIVLCTPKTVNSYRSLLFSWDTD